MMKILIDLDIRNARRKGATQVDYILAASIFLIFFALTIQYITDYFSTVRETSSIALSRSEAIGMLDIADDSMEPQAWPQISNISNDIILLMHLNNNTLDYSGKGNNGTIINSANCTANITGRFFSACGFRGSAKINISGSGLAIADGQPGTVALWFNPGVTIDPADANPHVFFEKDISFSIGTANSDGRLEVRGPSQRPNSVQSTWNAGTWYHVAVVWNSTNYFLYVNGALVNTTESGYASLMNNTNTINISMTSTSGSIDEVAIYNRSLTTAEAMEHYQQSLNRIGLKTEAFRFFVIVNNTKPNMINQSENATVLALVNELVRFNLSSFGFAGIDYNSVMVYNETGHDVPFQINGSNITFSVNITVNASMQFTVYFDDDSLFGEKSQGVVTEVDNLTELFMPVERIQILQYEKLRQLNESNYTSVRSTAGAEKSFRIKIIDADNNATFMDYGGSVPRKGNVVAFQRYAVFQNSTAGIRNGKMMIQTW